MEGYDATEIGSFGIKVEMEPPQFDVPSGQYETSQLVTLTHYKGSAVIRYTTDGSTPTETNGTIYAGPFSVSTPQLVKAIAYNTGENWVSGISSNNYLIATSMPFNQFFEFDLAPSETKWFFFDGVSGISYNVFWDDAYNSSGTMAADLEVSAYLFCISI